MTKKHSLWKAERLLPARNVSYSKSFDNLKQFHACVHCIQASLQELYEGKLRLLDEEVRHLQQQVLRQQKENANQKELNNNVQRAMTDMKTKYDTSATSWAKARKDMQEKLESVKSVCLISWLYENIIYTLHDIYFFLGQQDLLIASRWNVSKVHARKIFTTCVVHKIRGYNIYVGKTYIVTNNLVIMYSVKMYVSTVYTLTLHPLSQHIHSRIAYSDTVYAMALHNVCWRRASKSGRCVLLSS